MARVFSPNVLGVFSSWENTWSSDENKLSANRGWRIHTMLVSLTNIRNMSESFYLFHIHHAQIITRAVLSIMPWLIKSSQVIMKHETEMLSQSSLICSRLFHCCKKWVNAVVGTWNGSWWLCLWLNCIM